MSLTRIGSIGINTGIAFAGVTTIVTLNTANDALSIGATVNVGSGITLGASGDIFATGVCTATSFSGETVVGDTSPQLGGNLDVNTKNILFGDSDGASDDRLILGAGSDLQLYHDGSNSYLHQQSSATGNLLIFADGHEIQLIPKSGEPGIKVINDGAVELYHNGTKKFETTSSGVTLGDGLLLDNATNAGRDIQWQPANDRLVFLDNTKATFGNEVDLQIYHSGTYNRSYIQATGTNHDLSIAADEIALTNSAISQTLAKFISGASVELYENGTKVAETTSGGFAVEGVTYSNGLDMDDNHKILLGTGDDLEIFHDGSNSYIKDVGTGILQVNTNYFQVKNADNDEFIFQASQNGPVNLFYNNSKKFETHDVGTIFTQASSSVANGAIKVNTTLDNYGSIIVRDQSHSNTTIGALEIENNGTGTDETNFVIRSVNNGSTHWSHAFYGAKSHRFGIEANSDGSIKLQIDAAGIKFNGDTASANALNDYEEGTFTPVLDNSLSSVSYNAQVGHYTKIGNQVFAYVYLLATAGGSDSNSLRVSGLPFTCNNISYHEGGGYITYLNGTFGTSGVELQAKPWVPQNSTYVLFHTPEDGNNLRGSETNFANKYLIFHLRYKVA